MAILIARMNVREMLTTYRLDNIPSHTTPPARSLPLDNEINRDPAVLHQMATITRDQAALVSPTQPRRQALVIRRRPDPIRHPDPHWQHYPELHISPHGLKRADNTAINHGQAVRVFKLKQPKVTIYARQHTLPSQKQIISHTWIVPHYRRVLSHAQNDRRLQPILDDVNSANTNRFMPQHDSARPDDLWYNRGMAKVDFTAPIADMRGIAGGLVYSKNAAGNYVHAWKKPTNPATTKQIEQRGFMARMGAKWRTLTVGEQGDWDTFAATPPETDYDSLGNAYLLSGFNWMTRIALRRHRTGQAEDLIAPVATPTVTPTTFSMVLYPANGDADRATFTYTSGEFATYYAILELSLAPGVGSNVQTNRYLNCYEALGVGATDTEFGDTYLEAFGITQITNRFFARLYRQSPTGIRSVPKELFVDVVVYP